MPTNDSAGDALLAKARVEQIAEAITQQVEPEHDERDGESRSHGDVRCGDHIGAGVGEHRAPFGGRRLNAEAEERQP